MTPVTLSHSGYGHLFSLHSFPEDCKWIDNPPVWCTELRSSPAAECVLFPVIAAWAKPGVLWCGWSHISFPQSSPLIQTVEVHFLAVKQVFNKLHPIKYRARLLLFWVSWHLQPSCHCQGLACSETHSHVLNFSNWVCSLLWSGSTCTLGCELEGQVQSSQGYRITGREILLSFYFKDHKTWAG